jgi:transposase
MKDFQIDRIFMYFEIKKMLQDKFSISQISRELNISRKTVYFYLNMDEEQFWEWVATVHQKPSKLSPYESSLHERLKQYPDLSSYQLHDWLLEHYPDLKVSRRSVSNFVFYLRRKYHLPKPPKSTRDFSPVSELPYGQQAQVDFGEYKMKTADGRKVKVYFMVIVLSRSRCKWVCFQSAPFTTQAVIKAHEEAFAYFGGVPRQIVYDQDKLMVVSVNHGDILYTAKFQAYILERKFEIYLCRKADPQTKGKIENVVRYVKSNFLKNRLYVNDEVLNVQALGWLGRTANGQVHGTTRKIPAEELLIERRHLQPFKPLPGSQLPYRAYHVRKDNSISYKGNFYTLPKGTYQGKGTQVWVKVEGQQLLLCDEEKQVIVRHELCLDKGKIISNTDHRRDKSHKVKALIHEVAQQFANPDLALEYLTELHKTKTRYMRDQLQLIGRAIKEHPVDIIDQALAFCHANRIFSAGDLLAVAEKLAAADTEQLPTVTDGLLKDVDRTAYQAEPQKSDINDYESIVNPR